MIVWDFNAITALGITLSLMVVLILWIIYTLRKGSGQLLSDREFFRQCGFCSYLYFDYFKRTPRSCPRCGSYQD